MAEKIVLLGATGSIGRQTLDLLKYSWDYELVGVSLFSRHALLEPYLPYFPSLRYVAIEEEKAAGEFRLLHPTLEVLSGKDCSLSLLRKVQEGTVFNALMGISGLLPSLVAIEQGRDLLLSNKESLVIGSSLLLAELKNSSTHLYPVDSEHVALAKILAELKERKIPRSDILELIVTASGGSLRDSTREELSSVTPEKVLSHPTWSMGKKITVDSATMVNKGYETIEAEVLFSFPLEQISAVICRESLVHALVRYREDGKEKVLYEYSPVDMKVAIGYALSKGRTRWHKPDREDERKVALLHFQKLDTAFYPLFSRTRETFLRYGNLGMLLYDAVDSLAISSFLRKELSYLGIEEALFEVERTDFSSAPEWCRENLENCQAWAKEKAEQIVDSIQKGEHQS